MVFEPSVSDTVLYYYCLVHNGMANDAKILIDSYVEESSEVMPDAAVVTEYIKVQNSGSSDYTMTGQTISENDPILTLERGKTYDFDISSPGHPFWIKTEQINGTSNSYSEGIMNNGASNGILTFTVPSDAPSKLYYICQIHSSMTGVINIVDKNETDTIISSSSAGPSYGYNYGLDLIFDFPSTEEFISISFDI
jgi:ribosomal protein L31